MRIREILEGKGKILPQEEVELLEAITVNLFRDFKEFSSNFKICQATYTIDNTQIDSVATDILYLGDMDFLYFSSVKVTYKGNTKKFGEIYWVEDKFYEIKQLNH